MPDRIWTLLSVFWMSAGLLAQQPQAPADPAASVRPNYQLGINDQVVIRAQNAEEIGDRPYRIDEAGEVTLPIVGKIRAAGLTVLEFEAELSRQLRKFIREPQVSVLVTQYRSDVVFLVGAFQRPGIHTLPTRRTLVELLSTTSGLLPNASRRIRVTRQLSAGRIPLANAIEDPVTQRSSVDINLNRLMEAVNPEEDIILQPLDTITAQRTEMVYVNGEVIRPGAFEMSDRDFFPVTHLLALAGGTNPQADPQNCRVLRQVLDTTRRAEIPIDLTKVLSGQANDFPILPNDVLVIPRQPGRFRQTLGRTVTIVLPTVTTLVVALLVRRR